MDPARLAAVLTAGLQALLDEGAAFAQECNGPEHPAMTGMEALAQVMWSGTGLDMLRPRNLIQLMITWTMYFQFGRWAWAQNGPHGAPARARCGGSGPAA